jgi:hypothetical protein
MSTENCKSEILPEVFAEMGSKYINVQQKEKEMSIKQKMDSALRGKQVDDFIDGLDNGQFKQAIGIVLEDLCRNVLHCEKGGSVTLKFDMKPDAGETNRVKVAHSIKSKIPTPDGSRGEDLTRATGFFVDADFGMSRAQKNQGSFLDEKGNIPADNTKAHFPE